MGNPRRKGLPHAIPDFARGGELYFLTICGAPRGQNQFARQPAWTALIEATADYHARARWYCRLLLAMPDHVHLLASFPSGEVLERVIAGWKHYLAANARVVWQRDFFDHRLRSHESFDEKAAYIRANPVRAKLVSQADDWNFVWVPPDIVATPMN